MTTLRTRSTLAPLLLAALACAATTAAPSGLALADGKKAPLTLRQSIAKARREFQVYRGRFLERVTDRVAIGRSTHDKSLSTAKNIEALAKTHGLQTFKRQVGGRDVLHVVVDLTQGKKTNDAIRAVLGRVGSSTCELNFKTPGGRNAYGHVAVRVGNGPLYDLTGTRGVETLPAPLQRALKIFTGKTELSMARRRNLRRFFESRKPGGDATVYYGMLFSATPAEQKALQTTYEKRAKSMKGFSVSGGSDGVYSCAQFLTEKVPFWNDRGVGTNVAARGMASSAGRSPQLEAVIVYKTPEVKTNGLPSL